VLFCDVFSSPRFNYPPILAALRLLRLLRLIKVTTARERRRPDSDQAGDVCGERVGIICSGFEMAANSRAYRRESSLALV
jgi:hypothetical protein